MLIHKPGRRVDGHRSGCQFRLVPLTARDDEFSTPEKPSAFAGRDAGVQSFELWAHAQTEQVSAEVWDRSGRMALEYENDHGSQWAAITSLAE